MWCGGAGVVSGFRLRFAALFAFVAAAFLAFAVLAAVGAGFFLAARAFACGSGGGLSGEQREEGGGEEQFHGGVMVLWVYLVERSG